MIMVLAVVPHHVTALCSFVTSGLMCTCTVSMQDVTQKQEQVELCGTSNSNHADVLTILKVQFVLTSGTRLTIYSTLS